MPQFDNILHYFILFYQAPLQIQNAHPTQFCEFEFLSTWNILLFCNKNLQSIKK